MQVHALCQSKSPSPQAPDHCAILCVIRGSGGERRAFATYSLTPASRDGLVSPADYLGRLHILPKPDSAEPSMDRGEARRPPLPRFSQARSRAVPNPPVVCAYLKHASVDSCNPAVPRRSTSQAHTNQPPAVAIDEPESFNWVMCNTHASDIIFAHQQIKPLCSTSRGPWVLLFLGPESKLLFFPPAAVSLSLLLCIIGHCVLYTRARKVKPLGRASMDTTEDFSPYRPDGKLVSCRAPKSMRGTDGTHKINSGRVWLRLCRHRYFAARW